MLIFLSRFWTIGLLICGLAMPVWAQGNEMSLDDAIHGYEAVTHQTFRGVVDDWSTHHVVFSKPEPGSDTEYKVQQDGRYWLQQIKEKMPAADAATSGYGSGYDPDFFWGKKKKAKLKNDWSVSLGSATAKVGAGQYPAKFTFSPIGAPNCTTDYVVFNTGVAGATTQATILAFNNLYPGASPGCGTSGVPATYWAYNTGTGATAVTAVTLSPDGSQVAFIQSSSGGVASLVLLKWAQTPTAHSSAANGTTNGTTTITTGTTFFLAGDVGARISDNGGHIPAGATITAMASGTSATISVAATAGTSDTFTVAAETAVAPGVPVTVATTAYPTCTAPCMTTIAFGNGHNDTNSFPFYDYSGGDLLFAGDDSGDLHKFQHVFKGAMANPPAEVTTGGFPATVSATSQALTTPVYDGGSQLAFVGEAHVSGATTDGNFHSVSSTGTVLTSGPGPVGTPGALCHGVGYKDGPILDEGATVPLATTAGTLYIGCDHDVGGDTCGSGSNACLRQFAESGISGGVGLAVNLGPQADAEMFAGAFDHTYLISSGPHPSGNLYFCGNPTGGVTLYRIPILSNVMGTQIAVHTLSSATSAAGEVCSPVTEFYNTSGTPTDWLFMSVPTTGNATGCTSTGCVYSFNVNTPPVAGTNANFGLASTSGASGIIVDNASGQTGSSNIYYSTLGSGDAIQALQNGL